MLYNLFVFLLGQKIVDLIFKEYPIPGDLYLSESGRYLYVFHVNYLTFSRTFMFKRDGNTEKEYGSILGKHLIYFIYDKEKKSYNQSFETATISSFIKSCKKVKFDFNENSSLSDKFDDRTIN